MIPVGLGFLCISGNSSLQKLSNGTGYTVPMPVQRNHFSAVVRAKTPWERSRRCLSELLTIVISKVMVIRIHGNPWHTDASVSYPLM